MPKERPIKNYRVEGERPFKAYNLGMTHPSQFDDPALLEQPLPITASLLTQQQAQYRQPQQQLQQELHQISAQLAQPSQQLYHPNFQQNMQLASQSSLPNNTANYTFNILTLGDASTSLARPVLTASNESFIQHQEHDLNIPNFSGSSSVNPHSNFNVSSLNALRALADASSLPVHDSMSLIFDNSMASFNGCLTRPTVTSSNISSFPAGTPQFVQSPSTSYYGGPVSSSGLSLPNMGPIPSGRHGQYPIKMEAAENSLTTHCSSTTGNLPTENPETGYGGALSSIPTSSLSTCSTSLTDPSLNKSTSSTGDESTSDEERNTGEGRKDHTYTEKRKKNNESAKRSREARRNKEEMIALRVITLEEENMRLRAEINLLDKELDELRLRLFQCN